MKSKNKALIAVKEYSLISMGCLLYVFGWLIFLVPSNLVGGGVTGMASIIQYATKGVVQMGYTYFLTNVVLLAVSMLILGKGFGFKTVYAIILVSVSLNAGQGLVPDTIIQSLALENGKLMSVIMGALMSGVGIGMSMSQGGSTGGTDIIALVVNKYRNVSPGRMILLMDVFIVSSSLIVPSYAANGALLPIAEKFTNVVYGLILTVISSNVVDLYISGSRQSVQLFILSKKYEEIADFITKDLNRGVTLLDGQGWYTKQQSKVLMVITRKSNLNIVLRSIKVIDPDAFLSVSSVTAVYGRGFERIRGASKRD